VFATSALALAEILTFPSRCAYPTKSTLSTVAGKLAKFNRSFCAKLALATAAEKSEKLTLAVKVTAFVKLN